MIAIRLINAIMRSNAVVLIGKENDNIADLGMRWAGVELEKRETLKLKVHQR